MSNGTPRVDGIPRLTGEAQFTDDLVSANALVGLLKRSPHAHARIVKIDVERALKLPGVKAILLGSDLPNFYGILPGSKDETALALGHVRYVGEPVVALAAIDLDSAREALALIQVEYEPLKAVLGIESALTDEILVHGARGTNVLRDIGDSHGDVDAAFEKADLVLERTYRYGASTHAAMEPHSALARWDGQGRLTLSSSTQVPHYLQRQVAEALHVDVAKVRVIKPYVGAGYGGKSEAFSADICAAALSRRAGRPVRITYAREECFYSHRGRHHTLIHIRSAHDKAGQILGLELRTWLDTGAYASYGVVTTHYSVAFGAMPYKTPAYRYRAQSVYSNTPPAGPKRGNGAIQPRFALEVHLDEVAQSLELDPGTMRSSMLLPAYCQTVTGLEIGSNAMDEALQAVLKGSRWYKRRDSLPPGHGLGLALSTYISGASHPIYFSEMPHSQVMVKVDRSGLLTAYCGAAEIGQGSSTIIAIVLSKVLGLKPQDIQVVEGDTDLSPVDLGSYSSRVTLMVGNAAKAAGEAIARRLVQALTLKTQVGPELVRFEDGMLIHGEKRTTWVQAIEWAESLSGPLVEVGSYRPPQHGRRAFGSGGAGPSPAYSFTAQVAEVRVDQETGQVEVLDVWCAHDCGKALNPSGVLGQIEGCIYMGQGEALGEEMSYHRGGQLAQTSLLDYTMPTSLDVCDMHVSIIESDEVQGPFGAKEAGEGPQLSTVPAIANAVAHATGVRLRQVPMTPDVLLRSLEGKAPKISIPGVSNAQSDARMKRRLAIMAKRRARAEKKGDDS